MDGRSIMDIKWSEEAGIGCTGKCLYRGDGAHFTMQEGVDEDRVISYRVNDIHLYSIFDGHDGSKASQFASQQFPLELLLGQLEAPLDDEEIGTVIANAFHMVEEKFFDSLEDDATAAMPDNVSGFPSRQKIMAKNHQNLSKNGVYSADQFSGGTTAVMVVYCHGKLFFANCGDSIAVLCKLSPEGMLNVHPISILHNIDSEDEALRLALLGLNVDELKRSRALKLTRCIGNYALKKYYRGFDVLKSAVNCPIICDPEIIGGLPVNPNEPMFIYLMSSGLYKSWKECSGSESVEADIGKMIATLLSSDKSLHEVSQAVLEEVCKRHAAVYAAGNTQHSYFRREEMTLLIRNFGLDGRDIRPSDDSPPPPLNNDYLGNSWRTLSETDVESGPNSENDVLPTFGRDLPLEFIDPYVDFSELGPVEDFVWSDEE